jgi:hypothetical protein
MPLLLRNRRVSNLVGILPVIGKVILALRVILVLSVAIAAGHLVQSIRQHPQTAESGQAAAAQPTDDGLPKLVGITAVSSEDTVGDQACALRLALTNSPGALIDIALDAPCHLGQQVVIRHSGLAFSTTIGSDGQLRLQIPAMAIEALVAAYVGQSEVVVGQIGVPDAADYLRLAVQMPGSTQFDLRAEESGQVYIARSTTAGRGAHRITRLGDSGVVGGLISQVYSVAMKDFANPDLSVELHVTPAICGHTLLADVVLLRSGKVSQESRQIEVPRCGTSGDILLLKNLLPDLTLGSPE